MIAFGDKEAGDVSCDGIAISKNPKMDIEVVKEESKKNGKQSIKQAAKLPKTVITQVDDTTAKVVDTSVSVANQPNPDMSKGVDLLAAAATLISEQSSA